MEGAFGKRFSRFAVIAMAPTTLRFAGKPVH